MNRLDAISYVLGLEAMVAGEFSVGAREMAESKQEVLEALAALGVMPEEIAETYA